MENYSKEELWELYKKLPQDLQEAVFSKEIANKIHFICFRNKIKDKEKIKEIAKYIAYLLLGLLPPDEFQKILAKEIKLTKKIAEKISSEISESVFSPLSESLEALYGTNIKIKKRKTEKINQKAKKPKRKDKYREPIG